MLVFHKAILTNFLLEVHLILPRILVQILFEDLTETNFILDDEI